MLAKDGAGAKPSPVAGRIFALSKDVFAGVAASIMSVACGLSFAALIFASPLNPWLAHGLAATFIASSIAATFVALRSSLPLPLPRLTEPPRP
jgi:hypothetical protein